MFRAVAHQLYADEDMHGEVRRLCMDYMERNRDHFAPFVAENFSSYVARKRQPGQHGNHVELQAISEMFGRPLEIYEYSENPRNIFYPAITPLDVNIPIRLSYHGSSHYNSVVDPFAPAVGLGLGLPGYYSRGANNLRDAMKESEDRSVEQAMLESELALTDIERTEKEISDQIARNSYMEYLRVVAGSGNPIVENNNRDSARSVERSYVNEGSRTGLYEELLALEGYTGYSGNDDEDNALACALSLSVQRNEDEDDALARALSLSEQQYMEEMEYRYGSGPGGSCSE